MPVLDWVGKEYIVKHDHDVQFRLLKKLEQYSSGNTDNLLIEGDNLESLKSLLPKYQNKIKCIYIDPPYNTGAEHWIYNDNVNAPKIRQWLDDVVGPDGIDLNRHDKWLCMMYPRLKLLKKLLKQNGIIFVSIDDNESSNLKLIMDAIFGEENYLVSFYVQVRYADKTLVEDSDFQKLVETVLVYGKSSKSKLNRRVTDYNADKFVWKIVEKGVPKTVEIGNKKVDIFKHGDYDIVKDVQSRHNLKEIWASGKILDGNSSGRFFRDYLIPRQKEDSIGTLYKVYGIGSDTFDYRYFTGPKKTTATKGKYYQGVPKNIFESLETHKKTLPIDNFLDLADAFGNCRLEGGVDFRSGKKPVAFLKQLFKMALSENTDDIILDSFAGSGSTAHTIMEINHEKNSNHKFILIELESNICKEKTSQRIHNVIKEMHEKKSTQNLGFDYNILGEPLLDKNEQLNENISFEELASIAFFHETRNSIQEDNIDRYHIGANNNVDYYLLYKNGKNSLSRKFLESLDKKTKKVIFAEKCLVTDDDLEEHNAFFRQIPYAIKEF